MTQILVTKPGALTAADRKKLRAADIVCVEATDPQDVRLLGAEGPPLDGNDLFFAAMEAMMKTDGGNLVRHAREGFAKAVHALVAARREADKGGA